jgi:hypothetical protein
LWRGANPTTFHHLDWSSHLTAPFYRKGAGANPDHPICKILANIRTRRRSGLAASFGQSRLVRDNTMRIHDKKPGCARGGSGKGSRPIKNPPRFSSGGRASCKMKLRVGNSAIGQQKSIAVLRTRNWHHFAAPPSEFRVQSLIGAWDFTFLKVANTRLRNDRMRGQYTRPEMRDLDVSSKETDKKVGTYRGFVVFFLIRLRADTSAGTHGYCIATSSDAP